MQMCKQRSCYIAQQPWAIILGGIVRELRNIDPILADVIGNPPCDKGKSSCPYQGMACERIEGKDPLPVCPLSLAVAKREKWDCEVDMKDIKSRGQWNPERNKLFGDIWGHKFDE